MCQCSPAGKQQSLSRCDGKCTCIMVYVCVCGELQATTHGGRCCWPYTCTSRTAAIMVLALRVCTFQEFKNQARALLPSRSPPWATPDFCAPPSPFQVCTGESLPNTLSLCPVPAVSSRSW